MAKVPMKTKIMMGLYFFLCGVEYAVILPTLNGFILSYDANQTYLGIIMASFSLTGLISAPVFGRISDKLQSAKWCIIIGNIFEIIGNLMYFASTNVFLIWGARLVAGVGSGGASCIFGVVSKKTTEQERTSVFAILMSSRQIGLIIGPGFNIFLEKLNFKLGPWMVDEYTSPGFFMAMMWIAHTLLWLFLYNDKDDITTVSSSYTQINGSANGDASIIKPRVDSFANAPCVGKETNTVNTVIESPRDHRSYSLREMTGIKVVLKSFIREEVIVCLSATFLLMYAQTGLETALTPITKMYFNWGGFKNSLFFCVCGVTVIISFISLSFVSKKVSDRYLLLYGTLALLGVYLMFFAYVEVLYHQPEESPQWLLPIFITNSILLTIVLPFAWVPQAALFSKVTKKETQGFNQGFRLLFMGLGQIMGPLWAASLVNKLPLMVGVDLILVVLVLLMMGFSFDRLVGRKEGAALAINSGENSYDDSGDEDDPLLGNSNSVNA